MGSIAPDGILLLVLAVLAAVWAGWTAIFLHGRLNSIVEMRIVPAWSLDAVNLVRLSIEVENIGEIRAGVKRVLLAVTTHDASVAAAPGTCVGEEWVDFTTSQPVLVSSQWVLPKETLHAERIYSASKDTVLHIGMQIHLDYPWYVEILGSRFRTRRQTRTFYLAKCFPPLGEGA